MITKTCLEAPAAAVASRRPLRSGELAVVNGVVGQVVRVHSGVAWVTQEGDSIDHVLGSCEELLVDRPGRVVIQALRSAEVSLT